MKKFLYSLLTSLTLIGGTSLQAQSFFASTNVAVASTNLILIGPAKAYQLQILAGATSPVTVKLYDSITGNTNISPAFVGYTNYLTNVTYSYVSPLTGMTNFQTNSMIAGVSITNAASTNILQSYVFYAQANTLATYNINFLPTKGIVVETSTNASVTIAYRVND